MSLPAPHQSPQRYNTEADSALDELYASVGAVAVAQKINVLYLELEKPAYNFYAFGGVFNEQSELGCLEYEYLARRGLIELTYV